MLGCANCPAEIGDQVQGAVESWLSQLSSRWQIKYVKESDTKHSSGRIVVRPFLEVHEEGNRQVFKATIIVAHEKGQTSLASQPTDPGSWKTALEEVEKQAEGYIRDLVKPF